MAVKAIAVEDGRPVRRLQEPTSADIASQCASLLADLGEANGVRRPVCATGYGRNLVAGAEFGISEITANARGVRWLWAHWRELADVFGHPPVPPQVSEPFRTIVDVGGQDSKVIVLDGDGLLSDFAMNDRCAAGTGRFLEVMARVLEADLRRMDELAAQAPRAVPIGAACTVFAESEVISSLASGVPKAEVAAGVFESVAGQVAALASRARWQPPVVFDGGPSHSHALRAALARRMGAELAVPPEGQFAAALGAALLAGEGAARPAGRAQGGS